MKKPRIYSKRYRQNVQLRAGLMGLTQILADHATDDLLIAMAACPISARLVIQIVTQRPSPISLDVITALLLSTDPQIRKDAILLLDRVA